MIEALRFRTRTSSGLALLAVAAVSLAACAGSDDDSGARQQEERQVELAEPQVVSDGESSATAFWGCTVIQDVFIEAGSSTPVVEAVPLAQRGSELGGCVLFFDEEGASVRVVIEDATGSASHNGHSLEWDTPQPVPEESAVPSEADELYKFSDRRGYSEIRIRQGCIEFVIVPFGSGETASWSTNVLDEVVLANTLTRGLPSGQCTSDATVGESSSSRSIEGCAGSSVASFPVSAVQPVDPSLDSAIEAMLPLRPPACQPLLDAPPGSAGYWFWLPENESVAEVFSAELVMSSLDGFCDYLFAEGLNTQIVLDFPDNIACHGGNGDVYVAVHFGLSQESDASASVTILPEEFVRETGSVRGLK